MTNTGLERKSVYCVQCFVLVSDTNTLCRQLQRDIINVSDQQKTDVILFIKRPPCSLYPCITEKLFAPGTATCVFLLTRISRLMIPSYLSNETQKADKSRAAMNEDDIYHDTVGHCRYYREVRPPLGKDLVQCFILLQLGVGTFLRKNK